MSHHPSGLSSPSGNRSPVLFIGHGSPMNAVEDNPFTRTLVKLGREIPRPKAIVCISAHWLSAGTWVTHMARPKTIHDFYGFPEKLSTFEYPAPGSPETAKLIQTLMNDPTIQIDDHAWGLDHGAWSVLCHLYPDADVPVIQLSIDMAELPEFHLALGEKLRVLREHGVLIIGSGNVVHNLRKLDWSPDAPPSKWALEFDAWIQSKVRARDFRPLCSEVSDTEAARFSVPTLDHYLPLLYALGASDEKDKMAIEYEGIQNGAISMLSFSFGLR